MIRIKHDEAGSYEYYLYKEDQDYSSETEFVLMGDGFSSSEEILQTLAEFASGILHKAVEIKDIPHIMEL